MHDDCYEDSIDMFGKRKGMVFTPVDFDVKSSQRLHRQDGEERGS